MITFGTAHVLRFGSLNIIVSDDCRFVAAGIVTIRGVQTVSSADAKRWVPEERRKLDGAEVAVHVRQGLLFVEIAAKMSASPSGVAQAYKRWLKSGTALVA